MDLACKSFPINRLLACVAVFAVGCHPSTYRQEADTVATGLIDRYQVQALGRNESFTIETPKQTLRRLLLETQGLPVSGVASWGTDRLEEIANWPEPGVLIQTKPETHPEGPAYALQSDKTLKLSLLQALTVAARHNRTYQDQKESVYTTALRLDLEADDFRNTYNGLMSDLLNVDNSTGTTVTENVFGAEAGFSRQFRGGAVLSGKLAVDLVKMLSNDGGSSAGLIADFSLMVPLLRGAGEHIVTEALTQAERDLIYAMWDFERFKRSFAVDVADAYLSVLQDLDRVENAANSYKSQITSARRARRLSEAGRLSRVELDQSIQAELNARNSWIGAQERQKRSLDAFKLTLGLPADASIELDRDELVRLTERARESKLALAMRDQDAKPATQVPATAPIELIPPSREEAGPLEMEERRAIDLALANRLDLRSQHGVVIDAQRAVVVAANALQADLTLVASGSTGSGRGLGSSGLPSATRLRVDNAEYAFSANFDLPWERTAERNAYRRSYIALEAAARDVQDLEDRVKLDIRNGLRDLLLARETYKIQTQAVALATRRVESSRLFLEAGRVQIRDLLEAEDALLSAQNALTAAIVGYRVSELRLQRDMGVLEVNDKGLWREYVLNMP